MVYLKMDQSTPQEENVLYLGMADDIISPLLLVPNFTTLFVIDHFEDTFSSDKTIQGQKKDIKEILINGSDEKSHWRKKKDPICYLRTPSKIIRDTEENGVWRLEFVYDGKMRKLISYLDTNFQELWPDEVDNIKHIIGIGSCSWLDFIPDKLDPIFRTRGNDIFITMFAERTDVPFTFYTCADEHFPIQFNLENGRGNEEGTPITAIKVSDTVNPLWFLPFWDPQSKYSVQLLKQLCESVLKKRLRVGDENDDVKEPNAKRQKKDNEINKKD